VVDVMTYLHAKIRVGHTTVHGEMLQVGTGVLGHGFEDGLGLEAGGFEGGTCKVTTLGVGGDTDWGRD